MASLIDAIKEYTGVSIFYSQFYDYHNSKGSLEL